MEVTATCPVFLQHVDERFPMPDLHHWLAFFAAAAILAIIPGPGMLYVLARSMGGGISSGLRSTAGTAVGGLVHVVSAMIGLSAVLVASATAFEVVRLAGAAYLLWLGIQTLRQARKPFAVGGSQQSDHAFGQGIVTEALNPKTALFFLTFLPQFVQPHRGPVAAQVFVLGVLSITLNAIPDVTVTVLAGRMQRLLHRSPRWWTRQRIGSGILLLVLGTASAATSSSP